MKVLTWNINGIRAATGKLSIKNLLDSLSADIICLQETKVTRDMLDEPTAIVEGYEAYLSFSRKRSGYSGTANYCKLKTSPVLAEEGLTGRLSYDNDNIVGVYGCTDYLPNVDLDALDAEGRCVITQHCVKLPNGVEKQVAIINVYVPLAGEREDRVAYKMKFLGLLQARAEALLSAGRHVIILGDLNLVHKQIDNCEDESNKDFQVRSSRLWMNNLLQPEERDPKLPDSDLNITEFCPKDVKGGFFSDVFRKLHPCRKNAFTNWCTSTGARKSNFGRRLDYILVDSQLAEYVTSCEIMADFEGSDHCPVVVTFDCEPVPSKTIPDMCAKFMPEFKGQQQKLSSFFSKSDKADTVSDKVSEGVAFSVNSNCQAVNNNSKQLSVSQTVKRNNSELKLKPSKFQKVNSGSKQASLSAFFPTSLKKEPGSFKTELNKDKVQPNTKVQTEENLNNNTSKVKFSSSSPELSASSSVVSTNSVITTEETILKKQSSVKAWSCLLGGLPPPPLCPGHKEPCELKTVKKSGPNKNKQFYACARPDGPSGNKESRCNFFQWLNDRQKKKS